MPPCHPSRRAARPPGLGTLVFLALILASFTAPTRPSADATPPADGRAAVVPDPPAYPLIIPVAGVEKDALTDSFAHARSGGRRHRAIDIMAPTGTPVLAAADGYLVRTHRSRLGGLSIYQISADSSYIFYYAHLDRYAEGLKAGQTVAAGDTLGTVGMTGNAPVPHLHFAIWKAQPGAERFWTGEAVNPYPVLLEAREWPPPPPVLLAPIPARPEMLLGRTS